MAMALPNSDWSCLPRDIIDSVLDRTVIKFSDFVRFCSVCQSWRSTALQQDHNSSTKNPLRHRLYQQALHLLKTCRNQLPLMYQNDKQSLYSVAERGLVYDTELPIPYSGRCFGTINGWLFTYEHTMNHIALVNPFLHKAHHLPKFVFPHRQAEEYYFHKALLLSRRKTSRIRVEDRAHYDVVLIYSRPGGQFMLGYLRSGESKWQTLDPSTMPNLIVDIIWFKWRLYAVDYWGSLFHIDLAMGNHERVVVTPPDHIKGAKKRLVESQEGDLLLVTTFYESWTTWKIEVYKLLDSEEEGCPIMSWERVRTIGEQSLFVCDYSSFSVSTLEFPMCKANNVYFVDLCFDIGTCYDEEVLVDRYNVVGEKIFGMDRTPASYTQSPIWVVPYLKT